MTTRNRVDVIHGVNLDMLGRRPAQHYGDLTFDQLEQRIDEDAREDFRRVSVIRDLCFRTVKGQGVEGYRVALTAIKEKLDL